MLTVPYYAGYRYVAFPARSSQEVCILNCKQMGKWIIFKVGRVDLYEERPASLVYFDHCFHVLDVKVIYSYTWSTSVCSCFLQMCTCQEVSFGTVDVNETLSSCNHGQASQGRAGMSFHTAIIGEKVNEIFIYTHQYHFDWIRSTMRRIWQTLLAKTHLSILMWVFSLINLTISQLFLI